MRHALQQQEPEDPDETEDVEDEMRFLIAVLMPT